MTLRASMARADRSHLSGRTCAHCGGPQVGFASVNLAPLCHPDYGLDCYRLVTVYGHLMPCECRGKSENPDNDVCDRCQYRRFEHPVDPAEPAKKDFLGNPVPCYDFQNKPMRLPF